MHYLNVDRYNNKLRDNFSPQKLEPQDARYNEFDKNNKS